MSLFILSSEQERYAALKLVGIARIDTESPLCVEVKQYKPTRKNRQNAFYWSMLREICDATGHGVDVLHEYFKRQFIGVDEKKLPNGLVIEKAKSSHDLTTAEFADYSTRVQVFAAQEMGVKFNAYGYA